MKRTTESSRDVRGYVKNADGRDCKGSGDRKNSTVWLSFGSLALASEYETEDAADEQDETVSFGENWNIYRMVGLREEEEADWADPGFFARCRELSPVGFVLSGMSGLLIQICLFLVLGLEVSMTPTVTLVFLWILFSVISAGIAAEVEELWLRIRYRIRSGRR